MCTKIVVVIVNFIKASFIADICIAPLQVGLLRVYKGKKEERQEESNTRRNSLVAGEREGGEGGEGGGISAGSQTPIIYSCSVTTVEGRLGFQHGSTEQTAFVKSCEES